jgi:heme A synthase
MIEHRLAFITTCVCFALIIAGGLVHATGSGLACPDWPLCHGEFFPSMHGGVLFEHGHRLIALTVALLTTGLSFVTWRRRSPLTKMALGGLALVLAQATLGALTVKWKLPMVVKTAHLSVSMAFFSLLIVMTVRSRRVPATAAVVPAGARRMLGVAALAAYLQIVLGSLVRHTGSGLACSTLFLCQGRAWPSWGPARLQMLHRFGAVIVAVLVIAATARVGRALRRGGGSRLLRVAAVLPHALVLVQIGLGVESVRRFLDIATVTTHMGVGALLLADLVALYAALPRPAAAVATAEPLPYATAQARAS